MSVPGLRVIYVPRGCPAADSGMGCGCAGHCKEPMAVVRVEDLIEWLAKERDER